MKLRTCSVCGRQGNRRKVVPQPGGLPVCRDEDACYRRHQLTMLMGAMPTAEEEMEYCRRLRAAKLVQIMAEISVNPGEGITHLHGTGEPDWLEHNHAGGGIPHEHDPETGFQVPLADHPDSN